MRAGGGKQKGAQFERDVCVLLSKWVTNGKHEDVFWRSAMSGGRSTVAHGKGKRLAAQSGDISCIHHAGSYLSDRFFMECKFYRDLDYRGLITGKGKLIEFWKQAQLEAKRYKKYPMMFAKQNKMPMTVCLDADGSALLDAQNHLVQNNPNDLWIYLADDFFKKVQPPMKIYRVRL